MKTVRKIFMVFAVIMLCSSANVFAKGNKLSKTYLEGTWKHIDAYTNCILTLKFESDGTYVYGCNYPKKPGVIDFSGDRIYDNDYNQWWMSGTYEVIDNVIRTLPTFASGNQQKDKGKTVNWVVTINDDGEMDLQGSSWNRTYIKWGTY